MNYDPKLPAGLCYAACPAVDFGYNAWPLRGLIRAAAINGPEAAEFTHIAQWIAVHNWQISVASDRNTPDILLLFYHKEIGGMRWSMSA